MAQLRQLTVIITITRAADVFVLSPQHPHISTHPQPRKFYDILWWKCTQIVSAARAQGLIVIILRDPESLQKPQTRHIGCPSPPPTPWSEDGQFIRVKNKYVANHCYPINYSLARFQSNNPGDSFQSEEEEEAEAGARANLVHVHTLNARIQ